MCWAPAGATAGTDVPISQGGPFYGAGCLHFMGCPFPCDVGGVRLLGMFWNVGWSPPCWGLNMKDAQRELRLRFGPLEMEIALLVKLKA